jgi:hypothetical protein
MGYHKDKETLEFIEALKKRGESLGFKANTELPKMDRAYSIDLVWTPYRTHDIFITFEIESKENERLYKNFDKIFDLPSRDFEKPYYHFIVVYKGKMTRGNRDLILEKARPKNVHVFENLFQDNEAKINFNRELEKLKIPIDELIERRGTASQAETVQEAMTGLSKITPVLIVENLKLPLNDFNYKSSNTITNVDVERSQASQYKKSKYSETALVVIPPMRYTLVILNTKNVVDVFLQKSREDKKYHYVTAEACDYPFKFDFILAKPSGGTVTLSIDADQADVCELKTFEDFRKSLQINATLIIYYPEGKIKLRVEEIVIDGKFSTDNWYSAISDLSFIQESIGQRIMAPKNLVLTNNDYNDIYRLKSLISLGQFDLNLESFTFKSKKDNVEKLASLQKQYGIIPNISFTNNQTYENLLNQKIPVGPSNITFPDGAIFKEKLEEIEEKIAKSDGNSSLELSIIPIKGNNVRAYYLNWPKKLSN